MKKLNFYDVASLVCLLTLCTLLVGVVSLPKIAEISKFLVIIPIVMFFNKMSLKDLPKSAYALFSFAIIIVCSIIFNQDVISGYSQISKSRFFFIAILCFTPALWFFREKLDRKLISNLLYTFLISATIANILGVIGVQFDFNFGTLKAIEVPGRNHGLMKFVYHYGQNLAFFLIINLYLLTKKEVVKKYVNYNFLIVVFILNLIGFYSTFARAGWLGFILGAPFIFFIRSKKKFILTILIILSLGIGAYLFAGTKSQRSDGDQTRIGLWKSAIIGANERPLFGYGYLNFRNVTQRIKYENNLPYPEFKGTAHSNYFEALGGTGYLGLITFLAWCGMWAYEAYKRGDEMTLAFIACFMGGGIAEPSFFTPPVSVMVLGMYVLSHCWFKTRKNEIL